MRRTRNRKISSTLLFLKHMFFGVLLASSGLVQAQSIDVDPPTIELELVEEGVRGETQVFSATVTDNEEVSSMTLHYRFGADSTYLSVPMSVIAGTSIYTTSIDTNDTAVGVIQYYMEARDTGDNRTVQGFAFDPFERTLVDELAPAVSDSTNVVTPAEPAAAPRMSTQRKVAYGVIGLLVVGGLASALGGGGSSSGGGGSTDLVDTTVVVEVPTQLQ